MSGWPEADPTNEDRQPIRIVAGSRLHFGLLDTVAPFGGVGVMIDNPLTEVQVTACREFRCVGRGQDERVRSIADQWMRQTRRSSPLPCRVDLRHATPSHIGLGSGTQVALAVAEAISLHFQINLPRSELATNLAGRGRRSAVGVHGYFRGGLIYESSDQVAALNPVCRRVALPGHWCVAVLRVEGVDHSVFGELEKRKFAEVPPAPASARANLIAMIERDMLPAAEAGDFNSFADAVHTYNAASGVLFESVQCGPYNGPVMGDSVDALVRLGGRGVGQSSWGPGVFAWFESAAEAGSFVQRLPPGVSLIGLAHPMNQQRRLEVQAAVV